MNKRDSHDCALCGSRADSLFCRLTGGELQQLDESRFMQRLEPGQALFHEGAPSFAVYCIHRGLVKLYKTDQRGRTQVIRLFGPGEIFGYRAVLADEPYAASAATISSCRICVVPRETFLNLVKSNPQVGLDLMARLARELRISEEQMIALTRQSVRERTAGLLLTLLRFNGDHDTDQSINIPLARSEMAQIISTTPETLSRTLLALSRQGIIEFSRRHIVVKNIKQLRKLAGST